jgi:hypothetical protein
LKFLEEIQAPKKLPLPTVTKELPKATLPQASRTTTQWRKTQQQTKRQANLSELNNRPVTQKAEKSAGRRSFDKKNISESELASEKISYFG